MLFDRRDIVRLGIGLAATVALSEPGVAQGAGSVRRPSATYPILPRKPKLKPYGLTVTAPRGSFVLLHGWDSVGTDMAALADALQQLPSANGWNFYTPTYETHLETFVQAASDLYPQVQALAQPLILLGYSEGGIVARQLIANGMKVKVLVTICSPHSGLGVWIPTPDVGSASVSPFSEDLKRLNASQNEGPSRSLYHLFAISCTDVWGYHDDDGVVPVSSGLGTNLGSVAEQVVVELNYDSAIAGTDPHHRGMDPANLQPLIATCANQMM
jgi:pimeloyl-ACP methyl ester carboxylesterase